MKRTALSIIAGVGLLALVPTAALAHTDISIGFGIPAPVYAAPAPVYAAPAPVYYDPAPAYYGPTVVYQDGYGWDRWHHRQWEQRRWHEDRGWHGDHDGWRR